jgi:hypothetical protein
VASDAQVNDWFGFSVSLAGDDAIVGSYLEDTGGEARAPPTSIIGPTRTPGTRAPKSFRPAPRAGIISGAPFRFPAITPSSAPPAWIRSDPGAGAAYVYQYDPPIAGKLLSPDPDTGDYFGRSVSLSGDYAIVGAITRKQAAALPARPTFSTAPAPTLGMKEPRLSPRTPKRTIFSAFRFPCPAITPSSGLHRGRGGTSAGAAYIFYRTDTNAWDAGTKIVAPDAEAGDYFGRSVSLSGDYAIVGAHYESAEGTEAGAAYIFHRTDTQHLGRRNQDRGVGRFQL